VREPDLLRCTSVELIRLLYPLDQGIRLVGVTVSNFDRPGSEAMPLFDHVDKAS